MLLPPKSGWPQHYRIPQGWSWKAVRKKYLLVRTLSSALSCPFYLERERPEVTDLYWFMCSGGWFGSMFRDLGRTDNELEKRHVDQSFVRAQVWRYSCSMWILNVICYRGGAQKSSWQDDFLCEWQPTDFPSHFSAAHWTNEQGDYIRSLPSWIRTWLFSSLE